MRFKCCETKPDENGEGGNRAREREREWKWSVCCRIWFNVNCKWAKDTEIVETIYSRERFRFGLAIDKSATYRVAIDNNLHCTAMMPRFAWVCVFVRSFLYCFLSFIPLFISLRSASISPVDIPFSFFSLSETKKNVYAFVFSPVLHCSRRSSNADALANVNVLMRTIRSFNAHDIAIVPIPLAPKRWWTTMWISFCCFSFRNIVVDDVQCIWLCSLSLNLFRSFFTFRCMSLGGRIGPSAIARNENL